MLFLNQRTRETDRRNYFMINLHETMWLDLGLNQRPLDSPSDSLPTALAVRLFDVDTVLYFCTKENIFVLMPLCNSTGLL